MRLLLKVKPKQYMQKNRENILPNKDKNYSIPTNHTALLTFKVNSWIDFLVKTRNYTKVLLILLLLFIYLLPYH